MLKKFPYLLIITLLYWGFITNLFPFAITFIVILTIIPIFNIKLKFGQKEAEQISDIALLVSILGMGILVTNKNPYFFYKFITWLPFIFFPLIAIVKLGKIESLNIRTMFRLFRIFSSKEAKPLYVNFDYFYLVALLLSIGVQTSSIVGYILFIIVFIAVFFNRLTKRFSIVIVIVMMLISSIGGFFLFIGISKVQKAILIHFGLLSPPDPYKTKTAIGSIFSIKTSNEIAFRVKSISGVVPNRLFENSYSLYSDGEWFSSPNNKKRVKQSTNQVTWIVSKYSGVESGVEIFSELNMGKGVVIAPSNTHRFEDLQAKNLYYDYSIQIDGGANWFQYKAFYNNSVQWETPPQKEDLYVSGKYKNSFEDFIKNNGLTPQNIESFFYKNFKYSLEQKKPPKNTTPLEFFLFETKEGHCELYASTAVLLLRLMGIPARYSVGYVIEEFSELENLYIIREKHAHAWARAYINGKWIDIDTTPPDWLNYSPNPSILNKISDFFSWLYFTIVKWIQSGFLEDNWIYILPLFIGYLLWRLWRGGFKKEKISIFSKKGELFYDIERFFAKKGYQKKEYETKIEWFNRVKNQIPSEIVDDLLNIINKNYKYSFSSEKIDFNFMLKSEKQWLKKMKKIKFKKNTTISNEKINITNKNNSLFETNLNKNSKNLDNLDSIIIKDGSFSIYLKKIDYEEQLLRDIINNIDISLKVEFFETLKNYKHSIYLEYLEKKMEKDSVCYIENSITLLQIISDELSKIACQSLKEESLKDWIQILNNSFN
ncbi:hypothetical protein JXR93_08615 [bacterium]|nr:hypothetical protein [bacterium]